MRRALSILAPAAALVLASSVAFGVAVVLPDETQQTTINATVSEQANVVVPATVAIAVTDVSSATASGNESVSVTAIVLLEAQALRISLQANAADFTVPAGGTVTWEAGDVTWNAATWTNGTGSAGTLSNAAYVQVAQSDPNAPSTVTSDLVFTLGAKPTVDRAGVHSLLCTWKFESV